MRLTHVTRTVLLNSETWVINFELSTTQDFFDVPLAKVYLKTKFQIWSIHLGPLQLKNCKADFQLCFMPILSRSVEEQ